MSTTIICPSCKAVCPVDDELALEWAKDPYPCGACSAIPAVLSDEDREMLRKLSIALRVEVLVTDDEGVVQ